jgi:hypothetical protein
MAIITRTVLVGVRIDIVRRRTRIGGGSGAAIRRHHDISPPRAVDDPIKRLAGLVIAIEEFVIHLLQRHLMSTVTSWVNGRCSR